MSSRVLRITRGAACHESYGDREVHGGSVSEPVLAENWFGIALAMDVTMKGRGRMNMSEIGVYRVHGGKIVREQFSSSTTSAET